MGVAQKRAISIRERIFQLWLQKNAFGRVRAGVRPYMAAKTIKRAIHFCSHISLQILAKKFHVSYLQGDLKKRSRPKREVKRKVKNHHTTFFFHSEIWFSIFVVISSTKNNFLLDLVWLKKKLKNGHFFIILAKLSQFFTSEVSVCYNDAYNDFFLLVISDLWCYLKLEKGNYEICDLNWMGFCLTMAISWTIVHPYQKKAMDIVYKKKEKKERERAS